MLDKDGNKLPGGSAVQAMSPDGNGSFTLTLTLVPYGQYDFLFWADNADGDDDAAPDNLKNVRYLTDGRTIAFAAKLDDRVCDSGGIHVELKHVVTRIGVETTGDVLINSAHPLLIKVPLSYVAYDVSAMRPVLTATADDFQYRGFADGSYKSGDYVGCCYLLGDQDETAASMMTLRYEGALDNPEVRLANVPLKPDHDILLRGDLANAGLEAGAVTATAQTGWGTPADGNLY